MAHEESEANADLGMKYEPLEQAGSDKGSRTAYRCEWRCGMFFNGQHQNSENKHGRDDNLNKNTLSKRDIRGQRSAKRK
jgi:hypothetical protein